ncbi:MAG: tRNA (guanosine(37)-N1)-methyltransferase TrmD [Planctomycetota bacterium]
MIKGQATMAELTASHPRRYDILTLFPEVFPPVLQSSIPGQAADKGLVNYHVHNIRDYTEDKHNKVDDRPYGGGPGMVIQCQPVFSAYESVKEMDRADGRLIMLTPQGRRLNQELVKELADARRLIMLCGHYEGFDERIRNGLNPEEISVGDYVLSSGEVAALVLLDAVVRLVPGVLGDPDSARQDSFDDGMLEHPHYTRPPEFRGMKVPDVLLSGHHEKIKKWRRRQSSLRTRQRRADLFENSDSEKK